MKVTRTTGVALLALAHTSLALHLGVAPVVRSPRALPYTRRSGAIVCGWGPEPVWEELMIETIEDAATSMKSITIVPPPGVAEGYTTPGQYVQIRAPGAEKAGFFAIASPPGKEGAFEFLIKETPPSEWSPGTGWLTGAEAGTKLEMSQVMGGGFKIFDTDDDTVLLFAAGSGISPIRSAIEDANEKGLRKRKVQLFYGAQTEAQMAYMDKFAEWEALGDFSVTPVLSKPGDGWKGKTGYVQDVAKEMGIVDSPDNTCILLCGMKGMSEGVKELAAEVGIAEEKVMANF